MTEERPTLRRGRCTTSACSSTASYTRRSGPADACSPTSCATTSRLTGTHVGCEHGVCGACTVLGRRRTDAVLPDVRDLGHQGTRSPRSRAGRGTSRRRTWAGAAGLHRMPRPPVRVLHPGLPHDDHGLSGRPTRPRRRKHARPSPATSVVARATRTSSRRCCRAAEIKRAGPRRGPRPREVPPHDDRCSAIRRPTARGPPPGHRQRPLPRRPGAHGIRVRPSSAPARPRDGSSASTSPTRWEVDGVDRRSTPRGPRRRKVGEPCRCSSRTRRSPRPRTGLRPGQGRGQPCR
jgi:hypothetical protein